MLPWWKKALSYLWDIEIEYRTSLINPNLYVILSRGKLQLCTSDAVYSFEDKYYNFNQVLKYDLALESLPGNRVLILGLGLASIPIILDQIKPGKWNFTAVEIDEEVCSLAATYGYPKLHSEIQTIIADAAVYIDSTEEKFDLICVDIFEGATIPESFMSFDFLEALEERVRPEGLIVFNTLAFSASDKVKSQNFFDNIFSKVFRDAHLLHAHRNYMLISEKRKVRSSRSNPS